MVVVLLLGLQRGEWPPPRAVLPEGLLRGAEVEGVTKGRRGLIQAGAPGCLQPRGGAALPLSRSLGETCSSGR